MDNNNDADNNKNERPLYGFAWLNQKLGQTGDKPELIWDKYQTGDLVQKAGGIQKIIRDAAEEAAEIASDKTLEKWRNEQELERRRQEWEDRKRHRKPNL